MRPAFPDHDVMAWNCVTGKYDDQNKVRKYLPDGDTRHQATDTESPIADNSSNEEQSQVQAPKAEVKTENIGEREAWDGYCAKIRGERHEVDEGSLRSNWNQTRKSFFGDKPVSGYTAEDWQRMRDEGPRGFIPF